MVLYQAITRQTHLSIGFLLPWCSWPNFHGLHTKQLPLAAPCPVPWSGQGWAGCAPSVHVRGREAPPGDTKLGAPCLAHQGQMVIRATWTRPMNADSTHAHKKNFQNGFYWLDEQNKTQQQKLLFSPQMHLYKYFASRKI